MKIEKKIYNGLTAKNAPEKLEKALQNIKTMKASVQVALVGCLLHAIEHKDYTLCNTLVEKLADGQGRGIRYAAMVQWIEKFVGIAFDKEQNKFLGKFNAEKAKAKLEEAKAAAWWDFAPAKEYSGFNLLEEVKKAITNAKKAKAHIGKVKEDQDKVVIDPALLEVLDGIVNNKILIKDLVALVEHQAVEEIKQAA